MKRMLSPMISYLAILKINLYYNVERMEEFNTSRSKKCEVAFVENCRVSV